MGETIRIEDDGAVRRLVLWRPAEYNTITPALRDDLGEALDAADRDAAVKVVLLAAEGPAFSAGFGLDWSTLAQAAEEAGRDRVWDSAAAAVPGELRAQSALEGAVAAHFHPA
jgi:enoyl-CoA hydratase